MGLALAISLVLLAWGWPGVDPVSLPGLSVSLLTSTPMQVVNDGVVSPQFLAPGFSSAEIDDSSALAFRMWTGAEWTNETLYILVQGASMHVIPLYYKRVPDVQEEKGISETVEMRKKDVHLFWVGFACVSEASDSIQVQLRPYESRQFPLEFYLQKKCAKGPRRDMTLWVGEELAVVGGIVGEEWITKGKEQLGAVEVRMEIDRGNLLVSRVQTSGSIPMDIRGPGARGGLLTDSTSFTLFPDCRGDIQSGAVYLTIKIPPYDDLHLLWTQLCYRPPVPESILKKINIGSAPEHSDIVQEGVTQSNYTTGISVKTTTYSSSFFIPMKSPIDPGQIHLTYDTHLLMPQVVCSEEISEYNCKLTYRCYNQGESLVLLTIPTDEGNVEFAYRKMCKRPRVIVETEDQGLAIPLTACAVVVVAICYFTRRAKAVLP